MESDTPTVLMLCLTGAMASLQSVAAHPYLIAAMEDRGLQRGASKKESLRATDTIYLYTTPCSSRATLAPLDPSYIVMSI